MKRVDLLTKSENDGGWLDEEDDEVPLDGIMPSVSAEVSSTSNDSTLGHSFDGGTFEGELHIPPEVEVSIVTDASDKPSDT